MVGIPARILEHMNNILKTRLANKGTLILRDKIGVDEYGQPIWSETPVETHFFIRIYRVKGLEATVLGLKPEGNFVLTLPPITSPRPPREDDLFLYADRKYRLLNVTAYTDQNGNIIAYTALTRVYKTGEA